MEIYYPLFLQAFNATGTVIIMIFYGFMFQILNIFPKQSFQQLSAIAFKFAQPIILFQQIGQIEFTQDKLLVIVSLIIVSFIGVILSLPLCFLYKKGEKLKAFANLISISTMHTPVLCGLPITRGIYDVDNLDQYAFTQLGITFIAIIPIMYLIFEADKDQKHCIKNTVLISVKQPVIITLFLGAIYNLLGLKISFIRIQLVQFLNFSLIFKNISISLGILCLGMFAADHIRSKHTKIQTSIFIQIIAFIITNFYRCIALPIILTYLNFLFKVPKIIAEINAVLYMTPVGVMGHQICSQYGFGTIWLGIQSSVGVFFTCVSIPVVQLLIDRIYRDFLQ